MSLPRRYDSSVPRSRARCFRSRSRMLFSSGLASSTTSPPGSILRRTSVNLALERGGAVGNRAQDRKAAARPSHQRAGGLDRGEKGHEREQVAGFERASLTASDSRIVSRSSGAWSAQLIVGEKADRLGRRTKRGGHRCARRRAAAAVRAAQLPAGSARSDAPPRQSDRIRGPSGRLHASSLVWRELTRTGQSLTISHSRRDWGS